MEVRISEEFVSDLSKLSSSIEKKCWNFLSYIRKEDARTIREKAAPGWRIHQLKSSPYTSFSPDMNFRMLCILDGHSLRVCRIVKHDLADASYVNRNAQLDTPFILDATKIEAGDVHGLLLAMGLPKDYVKPFRDVSDEDEFIDALSNVDQQLQTYALGLYETTGILIPRSKYRFLDSSDDFEAALLGSMEEWELYLHSSQRFIVELPQNYRVAVRGPAGTGKTVCAWYRIQHLVSKGNRVGFVCANKNLFEVSKAMLQALLKSTGNDCYFLIPNSSDDMMQLLAEVDHLVIDEGQEIAATWINDLGRTLADSNKGITLLYDLNQLGGNIPRGDTRRIKHRLETWDSGLNSIPQLSNMRLFINYRNSKEIAEYCQETLSQLLPDDMQSIIPLFESGKVVLETIKNAQEFGLRVARVIRALQRDYADSEIGLIFNSHVRKEMPRILHELEDFGIETSNDVRNNRRILSLSPREIKGHERKAIILCTPPIVRSARKWGQIIDVYVALTRARDRLIVLQSP